LRHTFARPTFLIGAAALATGAALLVYLLAGISLKLSLGATVATAAVAGWLAGRRLAPEGRREVGRRIRFGLLSGLLAVAGYDLSRFLFVRLSGSSFWPFDTVRLFGELLAGSDAPPAVILATGMAYHLANGLSFATAYTIVLGYRGWWAGLLWALCLELLMATLYPEWLGLGDLREFLIVSFLGHAVYGVILGFASRELLIRRAPGAQ
jgi:hypothetical protein